MNDIKKAIIARCGEFHKSKLEIFHNSILTNTKAYHYNDLYIIVYDNKIKIY